MLGDRAAGRFLLSDAQFVLAKEHRFRNWAEFRADIQSQRTTGDRPVSRLWGGSSGYASQAGFLLTGLRRGDPDALARLRAHIPRYAAATGASTAEFRNVVPIRPATRSMSPLAPRPWWPCSSPSTGTTP